MWFSLRSGGECDASSTRAVSISRTHVGGSAGAGMLSVGRGRSQFLGFGQTDEIRYVAFIPCFALRRHPLLHPHLHSRNEFLTNP